MGLPVDDGVVERALAIVEERLGLRIESHRHATVRELVARRAAALREDPTKYVARLAHDRDELRAITPELTVNETFFFRHAEQLAAFSAVAAPSATRILSAACSTGEEAYTLAILARPDARITAFDLDPRALAIARRGRYERWSLRATPAEIEERYFTDRTIVATLRARVTFEEQNLVEDGPVFAAERAWHVVFCRNVLMYLAPAVQERAIERFARALAPGGYLFVGHAETVRDRSQFELCHTHGAFYFRKRAAAVAIEVAEPWHDTIAAASARIDALAPLPAAAVPDPLAEIEQLIADERFVEAGARLAPLPASSAVHILRALVATNANQLDRAEEACEAALALDPRCAAAHYLIAQCRQASNEPELATYHARRAAELDPTFAMARVMLGLLARAAGDRTVARAELTRALDAIATDDPRRLTRFGGGLGPLALAGVCRAELAQLDGGAR